MDNTPRRTRRQDDDTSQSPSLPNVMSKSTNVSQSGSRRATTGLALQASPSYPTMAWKAPSDEPDERHDSTAGASSGAASRREPRATDNQTTVHSAAALRGRQATTEQFDVELDTRSRVGKPPLDADNTQNVSAYNISASKETRAAQREGVANSGTVVSASSMQLPGYPSTNSPPSWSAPTSQTLQDNNSNISRPGAAPGPEETKKRNITPQPHEDSRSQRTAIRPHAEQVDRTTSIQASVKPFTSYPPPSSSTERRANTSHADYINRTASPQSSSQPSTTPSSPPFSFSERNATGPTAGPVHRTASSFVQPSIKPSTSYLSSSDGNATRPHAERVNRTASVQPPAKSSTPLPPLDRRSASISPSLSPPAPALAKKASSRMHHQVQSRGALLEHTMASSPPFPAQALAKMASNRMHPPVDRGSVRSDEQAGNDPSAASRISAAPSKPTPITTKPPGQESQNHRDSQSPPIAPDHNPTTIDLSSRQDRKVPSAASERPPVRPEHTPAMIMLPSLQDPSAGPSMPPVLPKDTSATTDPPSNSQSQPVSAIQPTATKSSANKYSQSSTTSLGPHHASYQYLGASGASDLQEEISLGSSLSEEPDAVQVQPVPTELAERLTGDGPRMHVVGDDSQRARRRQAKPSAEGSSISPLDEGKAQQSTGSRDMANGSSDRVRPENPRKHKAQSQRTAVTSPTDLDPVQDRDDDRNPLLVVRQSSSRTANSGDRPSRAGERDEPTHPGAAHGRSRSPPSTERDYSRSMHTLTLPGDTMHTEAPAVGHKSQRQDPSSRQDAYSEVKMNQPTVPPPEARVEETSCCSSCLIC